ncbi:Protein YnjB [Vibrio stylophorae]|uniref:Protein YnjB n=1 Tax=Vibrio stylophorae TaxID=659351 RepID=A0ABN8DV20_9VIBR|nr:ABC transporter substrate-binding protein [Vibrio stylophorae]CAH0535165.1 Protein YnjB [Vibrio stylophorae]
MKTLLRCFAFLSALCTSTVFAEDWQSVLAQADGQTVYFHAWGGSPEINRYFQWTSKELKSRYNITLVHVKVSDITESTTRLLAEKAAGKNSGGSVDMIWINGENFKSMKDNQMLAPAFVDGLPSMQYANTALPIETDFSEPTEGLEAPFGLGQLVFIYDQASLQQPPKSFAEMLNYAKANPNRLTYPRPPEFHGTSFLKALLIELSGNHPDLAKPVQAAQFEQITAPLWQYLDAFHQVAWRGGKQFPAGSAEMLQLLDDEQIDLAVTFNPNAVYAAQMSGNLAESTEVYAFSKGALTNVHFLTIPWNAQASAGAKVAINFLLSPAAQSRKGDTHVWGDPSILMPSVLSGTAASSKPFPAIAEPHPSWQNALEQAWLKRYGS